MIETSQELIERMRAEQTVSARVSIVSYKAQTIKEGSNNVNEHLEEVGICKDTGEAEYYELYNMPQLHNLRMNESGNYAVFEGEGISLLGMQCISKTNKNNQFGWWSNDISNNLGQFSTYPILSLVLKQTGTQKFTIVFSKERDEYAVNFDIELTANVGNEYMPEYITETFNITNNDSTEYSVEFSHSFEELYNNTAIIKITIKKWSKANARAKICQVYFGEMLTYEDEQIVDLSVKKGVSLINYNTESKTIELRVQDENEEYNIFEPTGALASINTNSALSLELGCVIDNFIYYVKVDEFYIGNLKKDQNSLEVTINGYGIINQYNNTLFEANCYDKYYPQEILDVILGYENDIKFKVDDEINTQKINTVFGDVMIPDGLSKVATAIGGNIIETVDNTVLIKEIKETTPVATLSMNEMFTNPEIEKEEIPQYININKYSFSEKENSTICHKNINISQLNIIPYNVEHSKGTYQCYLMSDDVRHDLDCLLLENKVIYDPKYSIEPNVLIYLLSSDCQYSDLYITGTEIEIQKVTEKHKLNDNSKEGIDIDSEAITEAVQVSNIINWLKTNLQKCFKYTVEVQDTFTYEIGDTVLIETGIYVNNEMLTRTAIITDIEYQYKGALHYTLTLKGA